MESIRSPPEEEHRNEGKRLLETILSETVWLGKWHEEDYFWQVSKDRYARTIFTLLSPYSDNHEKLRVVYDFMKGNDRNVSDGEESVSFWISNREGICEEGLISLSLEHKNGEYSKLAELCSSSYNYFNDLSLKIKSKGINPIQEINGLHKGQDKSCFVNIYNIRTEELKLLLPIIKDSMIDILLEKYASNKKNYSHTNISDCSL